MGTYKLIIAGETGSTIGVEWIKAKTMSGAMNKAVRIIRARFPQASEIRLFEI